MSEMMRWLRVGVLGAVSLAAGRAASAAVIASDSFEYDTGDLHGETGGTGWAAGGWDADVGTLDSVQPGGLTYNVVGGGTISGGSSALQLGGGSNDNTAFRVLAASRSAEVYVRFLVQYTAGSFGTGPDALLMWFDTVATGAHSGNRPNMGVLDDATNDYVVRLDSGSIVRVGGTLNTSTHLLVGRLLDDPGDADVGYDRFEFWVDPAVGESGTPDGVATVGTAITSFNHVGFRLANLETDDFFKVDELVLGETWADVVPVPEPGVVGLLSVAAVGLMRRRKT